MCSGKPPKLKLTNYHLLTSTLHHATLYPILSFSFVAFFLACSKRMSVVMVTQLASTWWRHCVSSSCTHPPEKKQYVYASFSVLLVCLFFVLSFIVEVHQNIFFSKTKRVKRSRMRGHGVFYVLCSMFFVLWCVYPGGKGCFSIFSQ